MIVRGCPKPYSRLYRNLQRCPLEPWLGLDRNGNVDCAFDNHPVLAAFPKPPRLSQIRSMRFVRELAVILVVEGTSVLKIYAAGPHKVGQIEPVIAMKKLMIDNNKRSAILQVKGKARNTAGGAANNGSLATGKKGHEVRDRGARVQ